VRAQDLRSRADQCFLACSARLRATTTLAKSLRRRLIMRFAIDPWRRLMIIVLHWFAPNPTGYLRYCGVAHCSFNWRFAAAWRQFILRIDTPTRSVMWRKALPPILDAAAGGARLDEGRPCRYEDLMGPLLSVAEAFNCYQSVAQHWSSVALPIRLWRHAGGAETERERRISEKLRFSKKKNKKNSRK